MPPWAKGIRLIAYLAAACQAADAAATTGTAPTAGPPAASPRPERAAASNATNPADVAALQALRASLTGLPMDWYASSDPCVIPWTGVVCNGTRVVGVNLTSTPQQPLAVAGRLSPGLAGASDLQFVELSNNKITGTLPPQWGALSRLALLALNNNALDGLLPANWSGLTGAKYIGVNSNQLSGQLPASWGALSGLQLLDVSTNGLGPDLPAEWGGMTSLQKLNLEGNAFVGPLPSAWRGMISLQLLSVRGMCGVCGGDPFSQIVVILVQGSSLGWQCSSSNCYSVPLGFIGQAAIIAAIILVLAALCIWRRVYVHRRRRLGMRVSRRRSSGGIGRESGNELPEEVAPPPPPVVVLQPDGEQICTARMDAEWAAALAAAQHAEQGDKPAGQPPEEPQGAGTQTAAGPAAASPVSQRAAWWTRLQRRRQATPEQAQQGGASDRPAPASVELPPAAPLQQALSPVVSGSIAASSSTDLPAEDQSQHAQQPGHGISRRHSADSSAAAAGSAFGPLRRASTEGQQGAEQAAAAPWGDRPRQRTSGSRRRPVPFYDIDLGQLPGEPSAGAGAAAHADRAPGYGS